MVVGYTGGKQKNPTYQNIMDATEAFLVEFDPSVVSYEKILDEVSFLYYLAVDLFLRSVEIFIYGTIHICHFI